uniref:pyridoxal phosphate-dependent aminotransferase n=1 Tax=Collinsella sp. TaxID=1965294 RepID=UPI003FED96C0
MREDHAASRAAGGILRARAHGGSTQSLGIACEGGASDLIDFSVNVNPAGPSPRAVAAACKALSRIDAYPDRESLALVRALARAQGIPEDTIVCGAGASDIIWRLAAAVRPKRIVVCAPTFSEYAEAASYYGACVQEFPLSEADDFDVPASFARAIEGPGDVAYLCNPNNPTGRLVDPRVIDEAACRCEQVGALLVVDECFLGFAPDARERSVAARAACSHHVAVLSAFTKLYGMAGLRLGYLISGNAQLIEGICRAGQAWPVSSVAEAAGIAALEDVEYVSRTRDVLAGERSWLSHELSSLGLSVVPSDANFLLVRP